MFLNIVNGYEMKTPHELGDRLREERERLGIAQEVLADAAGVGRTTQYNYERNKGSPDANYLVAVAAKGIDVTFVLTGARLAPAEAQQFQAAAAATVQSGEPELAARYVASAAERGMTLTADEAALLARFRALPSAEQESFLQVVGALASRRAARPRKKVSQVIKGDVGQVIKGKAVIKGDIVVGKGKTEK